MLETLKIKNVALTEEATIHFDEKLNIISGETGAGKSVLIDALGLILGNKADKNLIKHGEDFLRVEAKFLNVNNEKIKNFFEENDLEFDDCIIISRKISMDNKNEVKINGENVPLNFIKTLGQMLVDVHGQNDNLQILNKHHQLKLIDNFVEFDFNKLKELFENLNKINSEIKILGENESERAREIELLTYQIDEIENAKITENEENELKDKLIFMKNAEKIAGYVENIRQNFEFGGILEQMRKASGAFMQISSLTNSGQEIFERLDGLEIELNDVYEQILDEYSSDFSEDEFEQIDARLETYKNLHKKYGVLYEDIENFLEKSKQRREKLLNFEEELESLVKQKNQILMQSFMLCQEVSEKRKKCAKQIEKQIESELKELSMLNAKVEFFFEDYSKENFEKHFSVNGADDVELLFSANLGESVKPLSLVASGGEISRLMLAIKTITAKKDDNLTIIFDELDTGISGQASVATSKKLAKISRFHQILAISHQFQICAMADKNILIKKVEENGKTSSKPIELSDNEKVNELCRFLMVENVTESTIIHAKEVKDFCDEYKKNLAQNNEK